MALMTYPSELQPNPPSIRLDVPDGWVQVPVPQTLLALRDDSTPAGQFATNIVIRQVQRPAEVTETTVLQELSDWVATKPDGEISEPYDLTINDRVYAAANLSYRDDSGGTLGQMHLFTGHVRGGVVSIVQITASFAGDRVADQVPVVNAVLRTLWIARED